MRHALLLAILASLAAAGPAAATPSISFDRASGEVRVMGTAAGERFVVDAGDGQTIGVTLDQSGTWASLEDGVCSTFMQHATCDFSEQLGRVPANVVFDLGGGTNGVTVTPGAPAVKSVTVSYATSPAGITYTGGAPATVVTGGATDTLSGVTRIVGSPFADTFTGGAAAEHLLGGDGDDTFAVAAGGGPADTIDCGAGRDSATYRAGTDAVSACEVLNGVDATAKKPVDPAPNEPPPFVPGPPSPPSLIPVPRVTVPKVPDVRADGLIEFILACQAGDCSANEPVFLGPPAGPDALPPGWERALAGDFFSGDDLSPIAAQLALIAHLQKEPDQRKAISLMLALQRQLEEDRHRAGDAQNQAFQEQLQAAVELQKAMLLAALSRRGMSRKVQTDLTEVHATTPLDGKLKHAPHAGKASASKARTSKRRTFVRWLLVRTARALPTVTGKLTATGKPGQYRAKLRAPAWLRATAAVLRKGGVKTLPVDLKVGAASAHVKLPLPR
jgi:hypothetical protein